MFFVKILFFTKDADETQISYASHLDKNADKICAFSNDIYSYFSLKDSDSRWPIW